MRLGLMGLDLSRAAPLVSDDVVWDVSFRLDSMFRWRLDGSQPDWDRGAVSWPSLLSEGNAPALAALLEPPGPQWIDEGGGDVIPDSSSTPFTLALSIPETGIVNAAGDRDWFRIELVAGQSYEFTLTGSGGSPLSDPYLELFSSFGSLLSLDNDGGAGANARMQYTAQGSGVYYLSARAFDSNTTGGYTITATTGPPQDPLDTIDLEYTAPSFIEVYFAPAGDPANPFGDTPLRSWTGAEISAAMTALETYAAVTPIVFVQTTSRANAEWVLTLADLQAGTLGYFGTDNGIGYGAFDPAGTGWATGLNPGGVGFVTLLHEFGHGLGLAHPHHDGGDVQVMQGVVNQFNSWGDFLLNQGVFTVMSYNSGYPQGGFNPSLTTGWEATPGALDIALLQQRYGANSNANSGNTTYTISSMYRTIWDTGGVDTIVATGTHGSTIDLRAATLQSEIGGGGFVSYIFDTGGFTIAAGVVIENATGGAGSDRITGNDVANVLDGAGERDIIVGGAGNDTLIGGDGDDDLSGGADADTITGGAGHDELDGGAGADTMTGGVGNDHYTIDDSNDVVVELADEGMDGVVTLVDGYVLITNVENLGFGEGVIAATGNDGSNQITGNDLGNIIDGGAGADSMSGRYGDDTYVFDNTDDFANDLGGYDIIQTSASHTYGFIGIEEIHMLAGAVSVTNGSLTGVRVFGNAADNQITGSGSNEQFYGGEGNDTLNGGSGADLLDGGAGDDHLIGGSPFGEQNDTLIGGAGNDLLEGNEGADTLDGGAGQDYVLGGTGDDAYYIDNSGDNAVEASGEGNDIIYASVSYAMTLNIETLQLMGAVPYGVGNVQNNIIIGNAAANELQGLDGNDTLYGGGGVDLLYGQNHDDTLYGEADGDALVGGAGNDNLDGGAGQDYLLGGTGDDAYYIDNSGDNAVEASGEGNDTIFASVSYAMTLNVETMYLTNSAPYGVGNSQNNVIVGNSAFNELQGLGGDDTLYGGDGGDLLYGQDGDDTLYGENGDDALVGGIGNDSFVGGIGVDYMLGGTGNDYFYVDNASDNAVESSGEGSDTIFASVAYTMTLNVETMHLTGSALYGNGNSQNNVIWGNALNNELRGFDGNDTLVGGGGYDLLFGGAGDDTFVYTAASDSTLANLDAIIGFEVGIDQIDLTAVRTGSSDTFYFTTSGGDTFLHVDLGGNGSDDMLINIYQTTGVTNTDIIWGP